MWNRRWRGQCKVEDSVGTIDGNVVAEFVWFELKEMQQKLNEENIPEKCNTSLINNEAIINWTEREK